MKLLVVSGSQRVQSQSNKVASYLAGAAHEFNEMSQLELCRYGLPFWDGEQSSKFDESHSWEMISSKLSSADAMILITPEWGGMASPLLKNFLLMCDLQDTAHKPALLVSVSKGVSGAYPIAELRMNALKNNKIVAIPDHLIVRNVAEVLGGADIITERERNLKARINYSLNMLYQYAKALKTIRTQHQSEPYPKQQEYAYGM